MDVKKTTESEQGLASDKSNEDKTTEKNESSHHSDEAVEGLDHKVNENENSKDKENTQHEHQDEDEKNEEDFDEFDEFIHKSDEIEAKMEKECHQPKNKVDENEKIVDEVSIHDDHKVNKIDKDEESSQNEHKGNENDKDEESIQNELKGNENEKDEESIQNEHRGDENDKDEKSIQNEHMGDENDKDEKSTQNEHKGDENEKDEESIQNEHKGDENDQDEESTENEHKGDENDNDEESIQNEHKGDGNEKDEESNQNEQKGDEYDKDEESTQKEHKGGENDKDEESIQNEHKVNDNDNEESTQNEKDIADSESVPDTDTLKETIEKEEQLSDSKEDCEKTDVKAGAKETEVDAHKDVEVAGKSEESDTVREAEHSESGSLPQWQTEASNDVKDVCTDSADVNKELMSEKSIISESDKFEESLTELKMIFEHKNDPDKTPQEKDCQIEKKSSYENQFEKFLQQAGEKEDSNNELDYSNKIKESLKSSNDTFKPISEETSNSSWYKINSSEQPMEISETIQDEMSNLSGADNASVVSSNIGDSCLSFQDQTSNIDECSNLSVPEDSVPTYTGHTPDFDESANMNPPSNVTFIRPDTPSSITEATSESTPAKKTRRGTLQIAAEDASEHGHNITAADIFEYQWPAEKDADYYILQEQISIYLDIKSFKRKYPDLFRRVCDKHEKDFLREKGVVSETQSDLGLTALKSDEVHDLISRDYPAKYKEYLKVLHEKERQRMANKMKEHDALKLEKDKMIAYTKRAMKSASDWNRNMLKERNEERRAYFDMQTFSIQYPKSKFRKLDGVKTEVTGYPLSLIPGQFQDYYRKYTSEELKYFPLNTTLFDPPKKVDHLARHQQLQQMEEDNESQEDEKTGTGSVSGSDDSDDSSSSSEESDNQENVENTAIVNTGPIKKKEKSTSREASKEKSVEMMGMSSLQPVVKLEIMECKICKDDKGKSKQKIEEEMIRCSECKGSGHPTCLDLTDEMVKIIKTYPWQCMECKTCVECMDPYDEDKMMFCDKCDRGYHTFCVGLKSLPTGHWECKSCRGDSTPVKPIPRPTPKSKKGKKLNGKSTPKPEDSTSKDKQAKNTPMKDKAATPKPTKEVPARETKARSLRDRSLSKDNLKGMVKESSRSSFKDKESSRGSFKDDN